MANNPLKALTSKKNRTFLIIGLVVIGGVVLFGMLRGGGGGGSAQVVQGGPSEQLQLANLQAQTQMQAMQYQGQVSLAQAQLQADAELEVAGRMADLQQQELQVSLVALQSQLAQQTYIEELRGEREVMLTLATLDTQRELTGLQISSQEEMFRMQELSRIEQQRLTNELVLGQRQIDFQISQDQQQTQLQIEQAQQKTQQKSSKNSLFGSIIGGVLGLFSDVRLKENIRFSGFLPSGIGLYTWNYVGDDTPRGGPIAQEVALFNPGAVSDAYDYLTVDYDAVLQ